MDHFKVLEIDEKSSSEDIKKAYRRLAKLYHPDADKETASVDRFRLISASYEILKDERSREDYLSLKNGNEWEKQKNVRYNDVKSDFERAANKQRAKDVNHFMYTVERIMHPKTLFILLPAGIFSYWFLSSYIPSLFKKEPVMDDGSVAATISKARKFKEIDKVEAWKNPRTNQWESPAPWDPDYKTYLASSGLQKVDRNLVKPAYVIK
eukprot:CAMPEP_0119043816 /NCGR_PEP_ID=MMETSP1177-20130426/26133_1 /TAXON_ID=2985 /ORGANISM="Ochromonas sp, Strain CCMP1899" /LENGTH=208 /DNA_ID=CAMNT_0007012771 /DNA_START=108 /DNA_END=734 /DNA_ORIENTATION=+